MPAEPRDCGFTWRPQPGEKVLGQHVCARLDEHDMHRCCCGAENSQTTPKEATDAG
jgi:hypothetical protein